MAKAAHRLQEVLETVLAPLIEVDGGQLYLVSSDAALVKLHLAGTCGGCPGVPTTTRWVIEPAIRALFPKIAVEVTSGWIVPEGAERVVPAEP